MRLYSYTPNSASPAKVWIDLDSVVQIAYRTGNPHGNTLELTLVVGEASVIIPREIQEIALIIRRLRTGANLNETMLTPRKVGSNLTKDHQ